ncbi:hypothetical protein V8G54_007688 [Vigna mungo]|uniref:Uncharacterized protein n=1 Tax=Vigna mungo TaxID=3915 RepID=A0AAQ3P1M7_VIGMU
MQNYKNKGLYDGLQKSTPWSSFSASSNVCSNAGEKPLFDFYHFSCRRPPTVGSSSSIDSYYSFTAPGLASVGKVVPLPHKFSNYSYDQRPMGSNKSCKRIKHARDSSSTLCKLSTNKQHHLEFLNLKKKTVVSLNHRHR